MTSQREMTDGPVPLAEHVPTADTFLFMRGDWHTFKTMLELRGDRSRPRMAYFDGVIELMSPSNPHEGITRVIDYLVGVYCETAGIKFSPVGSWTHEDATEETGLEPDGCFIFGDRDVRTAPRADLAIEVVWTRGGLKKLEIYRRLRVPEIWFWDKHTITVHILDGIAYRVAERSRFLPDLDLALIARLATVTPANVAATALREALAERK